ncbi:hypothetical protein [Limibacillus sp. MBR-115]|jgi:hypothetical protein|uniref:hypothetical protein n=1 Tax=Limibacillus sp. MBR-115 TaxID=3156465 RepID=UPI0033963A8C
MKFLSFKVSRGGLWRFLLLVLIILAMNLMATLIVERLEFEVRPNNEDMVHQMIMFSAAVYAGLIAIPFVPGVEVGLVLITMLGSGIVLLVYSCTLAGLMLSFLVGRLIPLSAIVKVVQWLRFSRLERLLKRIEPLAGEERLNFLLEKAPGGALPFLLRHRYLALAVAINLPGNFLVGGGGGIALIAGVSRLFTPQGFLLTIALAVAPVPLAIALFGKDLLG